METGVNQKVNFMKAVIKNTKSNAFRECSFQLGNIENFRKIM